MPFLERHSTSFSEPWVAWTMLLLLLLLLIANYFQKGLVIGSFRSLTAAKERESLFSDVTRNTAGDICMFIYEVSIVGLCIYTMLFRGADFSFPGFLIAVGLVCTLSAVKYLLIRLTCYVFLDKNALPAMMLHYSNLYIVVTTLLYPVLLLALFAPFMTYFATLILLSIIAFMALAIWFLKAFRLFFTNFLASFYIFLYLCTLEIAPLIGVIIATKQLI